jgi:hypothetical protein
MISNVQAFDEKKLQAIYFRAMKYNCKRNSVVARVAKLLFTFVLVYLAIYLCGVILPQKNSDRIVGLILLCVFFYYILIVIQYFVDVIMFKTAIQKLQHSDWEYLYYVAFRRPISCRTVLSDAGVVFVIGHLLGQLGRPAEYQALTAMAVKSQSSLGSVRIMQGMGLSKKDVLILTSGLDRIVKSNQLFILWTNSRVRNSIIVFAIIIIIVNIAVQIIKGFNFLNYAGHN